MSKLLSDMADIYYDQKNHQVSKKFIDVALERDHSNPELLMRQKFLVTAQEILDLITKRNNCEMAESSNLLLTSPTAETVVVSQTKSELIAKASQNLFERSSDAPQSDPAVTKVLSPEEMQAKEIHKYFQGLKKAALLHQILPNEVPAPKAGWLIDDAKKIRFSEVVQIKGSLFVAIDPSLKEELGDELSKWDQPLNNGLIKHESANGIKMLSNKTYELRRQTDDERLIASKIYINGQEKKLILFDEQTSHKGIYPYSKHNPLQELDCPSYYEDAEVELVGNVG